MTSLQRGVPNADSIRALSAQLDNMQYSVHSLRMKQQSGVEDDSNEGHLAVFEGQKSVNSSLELNTTNHNHHHRVGIVGGNNEMTSGISTAQRNFLNNSITTVSKGMPKQQLSSPLLSSNERQKKPTSTRTNTNTVCDEEQEQDRGKVIIRFSSSVNDQCQQQSDSSNDAPIAFFMSNNKRSGYAK